MEKTIILQRGTGEPVLWIENERLHDYNDSQPLDGPITEAVMGWIDSVWENPTEIEKIRPTIMAGQWPVIVG